MNKLFNSSYNRRKCPSQLANPHRGPAISSVCVGKHDTGPVHQHVHPTNNQYKNLTGIINQVPDFAEVNEAIKERHLCCLDVVGARAGGQLAG